MHTVGRFRQNSSNGLNLKTPYRLSSVIRNLQYRATHPSGVLPVTLGRFITRQRNQPAGICWPGTAARGDRHSQVWGHRTRPTGRRRWCSVVG